MSEDPINDDGIWLRGIKIQSKMVKAMDKRFKQLGMITLNRTETIRYCINYFLQATAKDISIFEE